MEGISQIETSGTLHNISLEPLYNVRLYTPEYLCGRWKSLLSTTWQTQSDRVAKEKKIIM